MTQQNKLKTAAVLGLGISGKSAALLLLNQGYQVIGVDDNIDQLEDPFNGAIRLTKNLEPKDYEQLDLFVVSPGVPSTHRLVQYAQQQRIEVVGEIELACRQLRQRRCIGVTGTNGKTTVTLLIEHVLRQQAIPVRAVGNVGLPLTSQVGLSDDILIIELSSYQLEDLITPCLDLALILNITPDHLDRYASMDDYAQAKARIQDVLKPGGRCYVNENVSTPIKSSTTFGFSPQNNILFDGIYIVKDGRQIIKIPEEYQNMRTHHVENILAAFCICDELGIHSESFISSVCSFNKPPHRIEFVRKVNEVSYYNDSKGTNVDAVVRAVESMQGNVILIAGGVDKGGAYDVWTSSFDGKVSAIYAIGEAASKIQNQLEHCIPVHVVSDLKSAVEFAETHAKLGDSVLLSPGCSSYDMFRNYEHRGEEFKLIVNTIMGKEKRDNESS